MRIFLCMILTILILFSYTSELCAKRFGGGRSFGVQRSAASYKNYGAKPVTKSVSSGRWGGVLAGLVLGGLLATLFMGNGLTNGLLSWLIIAGIIVFIIRVWRNKSQSSNQSFAQAKSSDKQAPALVSSIPNIANFKGDEFLREVKVLFIRLQAAVQEKNYADLRLYTSPEVYAEISMQLQEEPTTNTTEIVALEVEILDAPTIANHQTVSVRFTGNIKEGNTPMQPLSEIWHLRPRIESGVWMVCGLQQE